MKFSVNHPQGKKVKLSPKKLGEGGEGSVHEIPGNSKSVAKILFKAKRNPERKARIQYMINNPPRKTNSKNNHTFLIWPEAMLFDKQEFVGFIMPKAKGIDLEELCRVKMAPELPSKWRRFDRKNTDSVKLRMKMCRNIAIALHQLHVGGKYVVGDLKPENIRVQSNGLVSILDLDSCQIIENGTLRFPSKMNTPKYNPPEPVNNQKHKSWDLFILGIIFYEILCGIHPFTGTTIAPYEKLNTPEQKIQEGLFPFGQKRSYFDVIPAPHQTFHQLGKTIQNLFVKCFDEGIFAPSKRPNTLDWINQLTTTPKIHVFKADKDNIISGIEVTLDWEITGADTCSINQGIGSVNLKGTLKVMPDRHTRYVLKASNMFGDIQKELNIKCFPTPTIKSMLVPMPEINKSINLKVTAPRFSGIEINVGELDTSIKELNTSINVNLNPSLPKESQRIPPLPPTIEPLENDYDFINHNTGYLKRLFAYFTSKNNQLFKDLYKTVDNETII